MSGVTACCRRLAGATNTAHAARVLSAVELAYIEAQTTDAGRARRLARIAAAFNHVVREGQVLAGVAPFLPLAILDAADFDELVGVANAETKRLLAGRADPAARDYAAALLAYGAFASSMAVWARAEAAPRRIGT